jgi:hypothetical protein
MQESNFGAPVGVYEALFLGYKDLPDDKPRLSPDGTPMPPAMEWRFQITNGEYTGQIVSRITSRRPTRKNSCGALLQGIVGRDIKPQEKVDLSVLIGVACQVVVSRSKDNPERTQVTEVIRKKPAGPAGGPPVCPENPQGQGASSPQVQAVADRILDKANDKREAGAAPSPVAAGSVNGRPELTTEYQVLFSGEPARQLTGEAINRELQTRGLDPKQVVVVGPQGMKTAADYQLGIPF